MKHFLKTLCSVFEDIVTKRMQYLYKIPKYKRVKRNKELEERSVELNRVII